MVGAFGALRIAALTTTVVPVARTVIAVIGPIGAIRPVGAFAARPIVVSRSRRARSSLRAALVGVRSTGALRRTLRAFRTMLRVAPACVSLLRIGALRAAVLPTLFARVAVAAVAAAALAALRFVETRDAVFVRSRTIGRLLGCGTELLRILQAVDLLPGAVERENLLHAGYRERREVGHRIFGRGEGHRAGQNVALDEEPFAVDRQQRFAQPRELLAGVDVGVVLVHHAAFQLRALPREFLGVERDLLCACGTRRDARETRDPRCTAQLAAAGAQSSDAARLLPGADLLHLDADVEPLGEDLDQLAEVDALVGDVVEDRLDLVALILHVADFHVEPHVGGDLPCGDHRLVLEGDGLLPAFDVVGLGLAVDLAELAVEGVEARAAHLLGHHVARERYDADVVPGRRLDGHDVAALQVEAVDVAVERAARVLEAHLEDIGGDVVGITLHPRRFVEFEAAVAGLGFDVGAVVAEGAAAAYLGNESIFVLISVHAGVVYFG